MAYSRLLLVLLMGVVLLFLLTFFACFTQAGKVALLGAQSFKGVLYALFWHSGILQIVQLCLFSSFSAFSLSLQEFWGVNTNQKLLL